MSARSTSAGQASELTEPQVRDYLQLHDDFFERHPDLLQGLQLSHATGSAISLVEKQVSVLRDRNGELRQRLRTLTATARRNDQLYHSTRSLLLALLEARSREQIATFFINSMRDDFQVEQVTLILFGDPGQATEALRIDSRDNALEHIGALLKNRKPTCGLLRKAELAYLFADPERVGSAAVMPLIDDVELGVIALGNSDANYYSSDMGTLFLGHIGELLIRLLDRVEQGAA